MKTYLLFYIFAIISLICYSKGCISLKNQDFQSHLATKTPYRFVENVNISKLSFPGCSPKQIWMVIRHGTRNPGTKYIKALDRLSRIQKEYKKNILKSNLCHKDASNLDQWVPPKNLVGKEKFLTSEGEKELYNLSRRMQERLPELFPKTFSNSSYLFKYTKSQRTELSAKSFVNGLKLDNSNQVWYPKPIHKDPVLRFYKCCNKWKYDVDKNPDALKQRKLFEKSIHVKDLVQKITKRLALPDDYLTFDDIYYMYSYCAFETAWNKNKGAWCSVFTTYDFMLLEYIEDLEYYWIDGYGFDLTSQQACVMIKDMLNQFKSGTSQATFYFTHSGTLLKLLAHLDLYKDSDHLTSRMKVDRLWKVSKIDAFGSNIAFINYSCGSKQKPFLLLLHQERAIKIPGCVSDSMLCSLDKFMQAHEEKQKKCDFAEMCSKTKTNCEYNINWFLESFYYCFP